MSDINLRGPKAPRPRFTLAAATLLAALLSVPFAALAVVQAVF